MNNPLKEIAPGKCRRIFYTMLAGVGSLIGATTAGYAAIQQQVPDWLIFVGAFFGVLTGPVWAVPASNVQPEDV